MLKTMHKGGIWSLDSAPRVVEFGAVEPRTTDPRILREQDRGRGRLIGVDVTTVPNFRRPQQTIPSKLEWQKKLRGAGLTPAQYMVLMTISTYTDRHGRNAHPGWTRLVDDTGMDLRTIKRAAKKLQELGWLIVEFEGGNQYRKGAAKVFALGIPARGASGASRGASDDTQGGIEMPPHQILSSDHKHHSAPTWRPHAAAWGAMDDEDKLEFLEEHMFDGDLGGAGEYPLVDAMVLKGAALPAIVNAVNKYREQGGLC